MSAKAHFQVDPRLASLLGENYRSTEHAIRELVDNAWDADADSVRITLPEPLTQQPIIVADDGCGMTDVQLRKEYLVIAQDRQSRRGEKTVQKQRPIRGRKGIGKFAGLVTAEKMRVETRSQGKFSTLVIEKTSLIASKIDLEKIDLPLSTEPCEPTEHGTEITLSCLNQRFSVPSFEALRALLALEFGRFEGFSIWVNDELITHEDIRGRSISKTVDIPGAGSVSIRFTIMDGSKGAVTVHSVG